MKRAMQDERFAAAPTFRPMRRKVAIGSKMKRMMKDERFTAAPVDKRGKRSARENPMPHYYLSQAEGDEKDKEKTEQEQLIREEEDHELEEEDDVLDEEEQSCTSSDDDQYSVGSDIAHYVMARHDGTPTIDKETHRLAVVNMNWDHIKAVDLYMVMASCIPKGGRVLSVSIYPSEFGLKCMNIETTQGPSALIGADGDVDDGGEDADVWEDDNNDDDGEQDSDLDSKTENNKLRTYGLNRQRFYYAVVVCDSSATAYHLYTTLDRTVFLKTANVFDLQFIPDSGEFKYPARDVVTEALLSYEEPDFDNAAERKILKRKLEHQFDDLFEYISSGDSSSEDHEDDFGDESLPNGVGKRKLPNKERLALLLQGNKSDEERTDDQDMEITFNMELEGLSKRILERKSIETKTVWEMHQEKKKEKRKARKRWSKDDDDYGDQDSSDDFLDDEKSDEVVKPIKKKEVKAKVKGNGKPREEHYEAEATKEELELLVPAGQDAAANGAKGYNIKRKSKKGVNGFWYRSVRKQAGKKGAHVVGNHL